MTDHLSPSAAGRPRPGRVARWAGGLAVALSGLLTLGAALAAPPWRAAPGPDAITPVRTPLPVPVTSRRPIDVREVPVPTRRGEQVGTLVEPRDADGVPGVVLVGGSGRSPRSARLPLARQLAQRGIAVLVVDKNLTGYDARHRSYEALAGDALDATALLRAQPGVDPRRVGLWGHSEGGWVVSIAAADDDAVAFVVLASDPVVTPGQQVTWMTTNALHRARLGLLDHLLALQLRGGRRFLDYVDAHPPLGRIHAPVLALYGADDPTLPLVSAIRLLEAELPAAPALRVVPGAGHALTGPDGSWPAERVDDVAGWISRPDASRWVPETLRQRVDCPPPPLITPAVQAMLTAAPPLGALGVLALTAGGIRRLRDRRRQPRARTAEGGTR